MEMQEQIIIEKKHKRYLIEKFQKRQIMYNPERVSKLKMSGVTDVVPLNQIYQISSQRYLNEAETVAKGRRMLRSLSKRKSSLKLKTEEPPVTLDIISHKPILKKREPSQLSFSQPYADPQSSLSNQDVGKSLKQVSSQKMF